MAPKDEGAADHGVVAPVFSDCRLPRSPQGEGADAGAATVDEEGGLTIGEDGAAAKK